MLAINVSFTLIVKIALLALRSQAKQSPALRWDPRPLLGTAVTAMLYWVLVQSGSVCFYHLLLKDIQRQALFCDSALSWFRGGVDSPFPSRPSCFPKCMALRWRPWTGFMAPLQAGL